MDTNGEFMKNNEEIMNSIGHPVNSKIYDREGKEFSKVLKYVERQCSCGSVGKLKVMWADESITLLCPKGLAPFHLDWKIS